MIYKKIHIYILLEQNFILNLIFLMILSTEYTRSLNSMLPKTPNTPYHFLSRDHHSPRIAFCVVVRSSVGKTSGAPPFILPVVYTATASEAWMTTTVGGAYATSLATIFCSLAQSSGECDRRTLTHPRPNWFS